MALHPATRVRYRKDKVLDIQPLSYLTELYKAISKPIIFTSYAGPGIDPQEANAIDVGVAAITSSLLLVKFSNGCEVICDANQMWGIHTLYNRPLNNVSAFTSPINGFQYVKTGQMLIGDKIRANVHDTYLTVASIESYPVTYIELIHARVPLFGNYYVIVPDTTGNDIAIVAGHLTSY